jgi:hypothetical protein
MSGIDPIATAKGISQLNSIPASCFRAIGCLKFRLTRDDLQRIAEELEAALTQFATIAEELKG